MTSWSKSVTIYTLWTEGPPLILDETEARRAEKFFLRLPALVSGSGWPPLSPTPLSEGMDPPLPTSNFIWGAPPRESELTCSLSLDKFPRRNSYTQLRLFAIPNQCAIFCAWVLVKNAAFIVYQTAQEVIREEPFDYQVFVEMRHLLEIS